MEMPWPRQTVHTGRVRVTQPQPRTVALPFLGPLSPHSLDTCKQALSPRTPGSGRSGSLTVAPESSFSALMTKAWFPWPPGPGPSRLPHLQSVYRWPPAADPSSEGPTDSEEETHPQTQIRAHHKRAPRWAEKELFPVEIVPQPKAHPPGHRASRVGPLQRSEPSPRSGLSGGGTSGFTLTQDGGGGLTARRE